MLSSVGPCNFAESVHNTSHCSRTAFSCACTDVSCPAMAMKKVPLKQANEKNQESEDSDLNDKNEKNGKKVDRQDSGDSSSDSITTAWVRKINASIGEETENSSMETMETMGTMAMYWLYEPMPGNRVYRVDGVNMVDVETMGQPVGLEAVELVPDVGLEVALEVNGDIGNDAAGPAVGLTAAPPHLPGDRMCEPCVFFFSCGCSREQTCPYCHLHYPERLHRPCKAKRERIRKRVAESLVQLGLLQPDTPL